MFNLFSDNKKGDGEFVVLEGLHAIKHAYRFGASIENIITPKKDVVMDLCARLSPDMIDFLNLNIKEVTNEDFLRIFPKNLHGQVAAIAKKKEDENLDGLCVWMENPNSINNAGAVIRVLAARGVKNLVVSGADFDIWHKDSIRAGAGLHFALNTIKQFQNANESLSFLNIFNYNVISMDPEGEVLNKGFNMLDKNCLVFGNERNGVSDLIKEHSKYIYKIPMQEKVSSLNLATSVAACLYFKFE